MKKAVVAVVSTVATGVAFAGTGPDFTGMTSGIDLTTVIAAIMAVGVIAVNFNVAKGGAKAILGFIRSAVN